MASPADSRLMPSPGKAWFQRSTYAGMEPIGQADRESERWSVRAAIACDSTPS